MKMNAKYNSQNTEKKELTRAERRKIMRSKVNCFHCQKRVALKNTVTTNLKTTGEKVYLCVMCSKKINRILEETK